MSMYETDNNTNYTKIKSMIEELENESFTSDNYKEIFDKHDSINSLILTNLENFRMEYEDLSRIYKEDMLNSDAFKNSVDNNIVSIDVFKHLVKMMKVNNSVISWQNIKHTFDDILFDKLKEFITNTEHKKIMRDTWLAMNEERKTQNDLFLKSMKDKDDFTKEMINTKIKSFEENVASKHRQLQEHIYNMERRMLEEYRKDRKEILSILELKFSEVSNKEIKDVIHRAKETEERFEVKDNKPVFSKKKVADSVPRIEEPKDDFSLEVEEEQSKEEPKKSEKEDDNGEFVEDYDEELTDKTLQDIEENFKNF